MNGHQRSSTVANIWRKAIQVNRSSVGVAAAAASGAVAIPCRVEYFIRGMNDAELGQGQGQ